MSDELKRVQIRVPVLESYRIVEGRLVGTGNMKRLFGLHSDEHLPVKLGKVTDEDGLIRFAEQYGGPGYNSLENNPNDDVSLGGDPVPWALEHARQVRLVIDLLVLLKEGKTDKTDKIRKRLHQHWELGRRPEDGHPEYLTLKGIDLYGRSFWSLEPLETHAGNGEASKTFANRLICAIINMNTEAVRPMLEVKQDQGGVSSFFPELYVSSVIEDAYALLHESAIQASPYRICKQCHEPFRVTEPHQRFCPNPYKKKGRSLCGNTYFVSRRRKARKEGKR